MKARVLAMMALAVGLFFLLPAGLTNLFKDDIPNSFVFVVIVLLWFYAIAIIPFSNTVDIFGTDVGLYGIDPSIGILYAFAFGAMAFTVGKYGVGTLLSLGKLMAVAEAYPDLKANQNFAQLQEELTTTENQIGFSRQHYNATVREFNTSIQTFPNVLIAGMFGFRERDYFQIAEADAAVPEVNLRTT